MKNGQHTSLSSRSTLYDSITEYYGSDDEWSDEELPKPKDSLADIHKKLFDGMIKSQ